MEKNESADFEKAGSLGIALSAKSSSVTSDGKFIYISNDLDKKIYCVDPESGKIRWTFSDPKILKVQSPLKYSHNSFVLSTYNYIAIINSAGKLVSGMDVTNGTSYWAEPVEAPGVLYIPTTRNLYAFDGKKISSLDAVPNSQSQEFIAADGDYIYIVDSLNKNIKAYNIKTGKTEWESSEITGNVFTNPVVAGSFVYAADIAQNIYRFDLKSGAERTLNINTGVVSNIVKDQNMLYFVAVNGALYSVDTSAFSEAKIIAAVDNNPSMDKHLIKKLVLNGSILYFASDSGSLFYYNLKKKESGFLKIKDNSKNYELIGEPAVIGDYIYAVDSGANIYKKKK